MDLLKVETNTKQVEIRHPGTGAPTGFIIEVASRESDAVKRVERRQLDKALKSRNRTLTSAQIEANQLEKTAATIVGWQWKGDASWGGKKLDFNPQNVSAVLEAGWLRNQVEEETADEAGFFENSPTP